MGRWKLPGLITRGKSLFLWHKSTINPPSPWFSHFSLREVQLEEDLEKVPEAAADQRYARDAEEAGRGLQGLQGLRGVMAGRRRPMFHWLYFNIEVGESEKKIHVFSLIEMKKIHRNPESGWSWIINRFGMCWNQPVHLEDVGFRRFCQKTGTTPAEEATPWPLRGLFARWDGRAPRWKDGPVVLDRHFSSEAMGALMMNGLMQSIINYQ